MVMMEEGDFFGMGSLAFQSGSCDNSDSLSNTFMNNKDDGGAASVATANMLLLKNKILSLQSVHNSYEEKNSENRALKAEMEKMRKHVVAQTRVCSMLKKQVQMAVGGDALKETQDLKKELAAKTMECEGARNSLAGMQGLLDQMKGAVEYAESKRDEARTALELNEALISCLRSKNDTYVKQLRMVMENKEFQKSEKKEKLVVTKQLKGMQRRLDTCKVERDVLADQLARTASHLCLSEEQLKKSHAEIEFMKMSMEEMRLQLFAGTGLNRSLTSEVCRSPISTETSPNLIPANANLSTSHFSKLDVEQEDADTATPAAGCPTPRYTAPRAVSLSSELCLTPVSSLPSPCTSTPSPMLSTASLQAASPGSTTGIACMQRGVASPPLVQSLALRGVKTRRAKRSTRRPVLSTLDVSSSSSDSDESSPPLPRRSCTPSPSPPAPAVETDRATVGNTHRSLLGSLGVSASSSSASSSSDSDASSPPLVQQDCAPSTGLAPTAKTDGVSIGNTRQSLLGSLDVSSASSSSDSDSSSKHVPSPAHRKITTADSPSKGEVTEVKGKVLAESPCKAEALAPIETTATPPSFIAGVARIQRCVASPPLVQSLTSRGIKTRRVKRSTRQSVLSTLDVSSSSPDSDESSPPLPPQSCAPSPPVAAAPTVVVATAGVTLSNVRQSLLGSLEVSSSSAASSSDSDSSSRHVPSPAHRKTATADSPGKATALAPIQTTATSPRNTAVESLSTASVKSPGDTAVSLSGPAPAALALRTMFGEDFDSSDGEDARYVAPARTSPVKTSLSSPPCKRRNRSASSSPSSRHTDDLQRIFAQWRGLGGLLAIDAGIPDLTPRQRAAAGCS